MVVALACALLASHHVQASLLGWDAAWYRDIGTVGYAGLPVGAWRFFPGWPLLVDGISAVTPFSVGVSLVVLANVSAAIYVRLLHTLGRGLGMPPSAVSAAGYVAYFAPAAFVLVMGYAEALFGVVSVSVLLASRRQAWWWCALAAAVAGFTRPTALLLCVPLAVEAVVSTAARGTRRPALGALVATLAPLLGAGAFLTYSALSTGDALTPFRAQTATDLRGGVVVDPIRTLIQGFRGLLGGRPDANFLAHLVVIPVALGLVWYGRRRLPASFTAYSLVVLASACTAAHFGSFERYAASAVPLVLAAGLVLAERPRLRRVVVVLGPVVMAALAWLSFADVYVP